MGRLPGLEEGAAGQCLALRGESSQMVKRDCRDNAIGKLEAQWRARLPSAAGGSPGAWSRHSPRLCSTALGKVGQHADLEPEGGAGLLVELGTQVATACVGCCLSTSPLVRYGANHRGRRGMEGSCGILPRRTKRGSSAGFLSEMLPNFGENSS